MDKLNASDKVYKIIEQKILSQEWTPGMKIASENKLSKELGVSRMSVREAMEKLVALNVLTKRQGEGTFINDLNPSIYLNGLIPMILLDKDNLIDILEFRSILEVDSTRLCAERCSHEDILYLEKCYEKMVKNKNNSEEFYLADYKFHMGIAKATKNTLIIKINSIMTDLLIFHQKEIHQYLGPQGGLKEHIKILDAIKNRDCELAALFMKRHIQSTLNRIRKIKSNGKG